MGCFRFQNMGFGQNDLCIPVLAKIYFESKTNVSAVSWDNMGGNVVCSGVLKLRVFTRFHWQLALHSMP